jgi:hypothetical protein
VLNGSNRRQKCLEFREALSFRQTAGLPGEPVGSQPLVTDQALDFRESHSANMA